MTQDKIIRDCENLLDGSTEDPMYKMLLLIMNFAMQLDAERKMGAAKGEHSADRKDSLSGTRERRFDTRPGTFNLQIPKFRKSGYIPFFLKNRQRSEEALVSMVVEAYTNGVSTRKIKHLAESLGIEDISAGEVSTMNKSLDDMVKDFKEKTLEKEYPVLWIDAVYEKIRVNKHVTSKALMIVKAINLDEKPEIIAVEAMDNESEATYTEHFNKLKSRGIEKVWLCVSDAHTGLQAAIRKCWTGSVWQSTRFISCVT